MKSQCAFKVLLLVLFVGIAMNGLAAAAAAATVAVPDTGQTKFYDNSEISKPAPGKPFYGQDAQYVRDRSYTKLDADGNELPDSASVWYQVRDNVTGLIWEVKQDADGRRNYDNLHAAINRYVWYDSNPTTDGGHSGTSSDGHDTEDFINALNAGSGYCGHTDWRLPTIKELSYLVNASRFRPAIDNTFFPHTLNNYGYWSSTTVACDVTQAWCVHFIDGNCFGQKKDSANYVRAVRGGRSQLLDNLIDNGDGTVSDLTTGLMWQQEEVDRMNWQDALAYCENLELGNNPGGGYYNDWHLPDRNELQSLVDYRRYKACLATTFFPEISQTSWISTLSSFYWSSTTVVNNTENACGCSFYDGACRGESKSEEWYVRAVRELGSAVISVRPTSVNLGVVKINTSTVKKMVIANEGDTDLVISHVLISGPNAAFFSVSTDSCNKQTIISPGMSCEITITFFPDSVGEKEAILVVDSNDPYKSTLNVTLSAMVVEEIVSTSDNRHNAVPSHALPVVEFPANVVPSDNEVCVGACDDIMIQPTLSVLSTDVGKTATLIMYVYLPGVGFGVNIPSKSKVLTAETKFDLLLHPIKFSDYPGLKLHIYYGYVLGTAIKYNAYSIVVEASCYPDCDSITDASLCNANPECEWQMFPTAKCIVKCSQFTSENECVNALNEACRWDTMLSVCIPK